MKRMTKFIYTVACIGIMSIPVIAQEEDQNIEEEQRVEKTFRVSSGGELEVSITSGSIKIMPGKSEQVQITTDEMMPEEIRQLEIYQTGNNVTIKTNHHSSFNGDLTLQVAVPAEYNLDLRTMSGDIFVGDNLRGKLTASTSGGDIKVKDVNGEVKVSTSGGDIAVGNTDGDLDISTMGGDISVGKVQGRAKLNTMGGNILVSDIGKSLKAVTYGGDITMGNIGGDADAESFGGDIMVRNVSGQARISTKGGSLRCDGANGRIIANSAGGDIELKNITGSVDAQTNSGDISIELFPSGKSESRISTMMGDVNLYLPENAKATVNAVIRIRGAWMDNDEHSIHSDFKSQSYGTDPDEKNIKGVYVLNGGGDKISIKTINSDIYIKNMNKKPQSEN
ncbi:MAG: DUF4097 family beta strand repeat-containing protein [Bacteroidota bacterium]